MLLSTKVLSIHCRWVVSFAPSVREEGACSSPTPGHVKDPLGTVRSTMQRGMATSRES